MTLKPEDPRPSPVGREEVARWICRTVRIAQGFKGTAEYTLDDEVHNAWDDWLDEADDLLALFFPADGWRLVPTDPDGAMKMAGCAAPRSDATRAATNTLERQMETVADIYRAMLTAAPAAPVAPVNLWRPIETAEACDAKQD